MDRSEDNNTLLAVAVGAGFVWWWYRQQQQLAVQVGTDSSFTGDVATVETKISNYVGAKVTGQTRGERNNNPGNIIRDNPQTQWQGIAPVQQDSKFVQFLDALHGIRAAHINLLTAFNVHGRTNVHDIITAYAPAKDDNNTAAYIAFISNALGVAPTQTINMNDLPTASAFVDAVIRQENNRNIYVSDGTFAQAMAMT